MGKIDIKQRNPLSLDVACSHRLVGLLAWSPAGGTAVGDCGSLRKKGLAGGSRSLGNRALRFIV